MRWLRMDRTGTRTARPRSGGLPGVLAPACVALALAAAGTAALTGSALAAQPFPKVSPAQVAAWQEHGERFLFIDTRPRLQYDLRHARGAVTIPAFAFASATIPRGLKLVLYDGGAGSTEADSAAGVLSARGQADFYLLDGGLTAWEAEGLPIVAPPGKSAAPLVDPIGAQALERLIAEGARLTIIDLRPAAAYREGHLPGAVSAPTPALLDRAAAAHRVSDLMVVYDDGNGDARERAEQLRRKGFRAVKYLYGGLLAWSEKKSGVVK